MPVVLRFFVDLDARFYYLLCKGHGNWFLDRVASFQESNTLLKSGVFIALYWYFWFRKSAERQHRRKTILTIMGATLVGLIAARLVATVLPFRVRPLYDPNLLQFPLSFQAPTNFVDWSSFPSDHAAYLGALGFGLIYLSRRLTIPVTAYFACWICFPRMYLGIHYASDIVAGTAIGALTVWTAIKIGVAGSRLARSVLAFADAKPEWFYPAAYLGLFEMSNIFYDVRLAIRAALHVAATSKYGREILIGLICAGAVAFAGIAKRYLVGDSSGDQLGAELDPKTETSGS